MKKIHFDSNGRIANLKKLAEPLTKEYILDAVEEYLNSDMTIPSYSHSTTYDLIINDIPYPPKVIFGLAMSKLLQMEVLATHFTGGLNSPCFTVLEGLEFKIRLKEGIPWSDSELKESVSKYLNMLRLEQEGEKFYKAKVYRYLSQKFKRSAKAYEFRMQNISYVFELLGRRWVTGLKPKRNITAKQVEIVERFIAELENKPFEGLATFEAEVKDSVKSKQQEKPTGSTNPKTSTTTTTTYARDPKVKAWVLKRANGVCECCGEDAPFKTSSGEPFLEVHHLIRLMDNGPDTVENCAGICPNCHRRLHYGEDRDTLTSEMLAKIEKEA